MFGSTLEPSQILLITHTNGHCPSLIRSLDWRVVSGDTKPTGCYHPEEEKYHKSPGIDSGISHTPSYWSTSPIIIGRVESELTARERQRRALEEWEEKRGLHCCTLTRFVAIVFQSEPMYSGRVSSHKKCLFFMLPRHHQKGLDWPSTFGTVNGWRMTRKLTRCMEYMQQQPIT